MIPLQEFVHRLRTDIAEAETEIAGRVLQGEAETFDRYQYFVGHIAGLRAAREALDDLVKRVNAGE